MRKYIYLILIFVYAFIPLFVMSDQIVNKNFDETLNISSHEISKLTMDTPSNRHYKSTTNKKEIKRITDYFNCVTYERMLADRTGYMPDRASIIYLDGNGHTNFIVPYKKEVMINHKLYKVKNGEIEGKFLKSFYDSLGD
ncbi:hypothetical protein KQI49_08170 [Virgibacillus sp. MSJ-26]|uniref:hypothetical protein n=1 Tax=Virgibacillus sp. MSJ-26 TaxID=2841522 RepID=UPI001C11B1F2|nr:hypothetical protein [Virgibacillus sp. MSJ-26]MBU5466807.1 hypothetical protein [Virgibacillus sp. MSJ-26]